MDCTLCGIEQMIRTVMKCICSPSLSYICCCCVCSDDIAHLQQSARCINESLSVCEHMRSASSLTPLYQSFHDESPELLAR
ncbi:hypothetical protein BC629DRAFT_1048531 [Irpex lacteus]|nr:hypothetical protein BC629DRAFT_1048531 [Irpex lacteus]